MSVKLQEQFLQAFYEDFDAEDTQISEGIADTLDSLMDRRFNAVYKGRGLDKRVAELVDKYPEIFTNKTYDSESKEYVEEGLIRSYEYNDGVSDIRNQVVQGKMSREEGENNLRWMDKMLDESRLTEKMWDYTLKSGVALRNAVDSEDVDEILTQLHNAYDELHSAGIIDDLDFSRAVDDLDEVELANDIEDAIDYELTNLYDLCDNLNVWVALNSIDESWLPDDVVVSDYNFDDWSDELRALYDKHKISQEEYRSRMKELWAGYFKTYPDFAPSEMQAKTLESLEESLLPIEKMKKEIEAAKTKLIQQAKKRGVSENFGQREVTRIANKYSDLQLDYYSDYASLLNKFSAWCAEYEG